MDFVNSSRDAKTRATASDALVSKHAAASLGYFRDDSVEYFCTGSTARRPPVINRGYFTRVTVFKKIIDLFLFSTSTHARRQIVCLGCGFDTISFECGSPGTVFLEIDYEEIIGKKVDIITGQPALLRKVLGDGTISTSAEVKRGYGYDLGSLQLISADLRDPGAVRARLAEAGADWKAPTLVLTECVLVYLDMIFASNLCSTLQGSFSSCAWASYDMINPTDRFGVMMAQNLRDSGFHIPGFSDYPSLDAQKARFTVDPNWVLAAACTMTQAHDKIVSAEERAAADKIERLDELEEWVMLMNHYSVTVATNDSDMFSRLVQLIPLPS